MPSELFSVSCRICIGSTFVDDHGEVVGSRGLQPACPLFKGSAAIGKPWRYDQSQRGHMVSQMGPGRRDLGTLQLPLAKVPDLLQIQCMNQTGSFR
eukprot:s563_g5.t1